LFEPCYNTENNLNYLNKIIIKKYIIILEAIVNFIIENVLLGYQQYLLQDTKCWYEESGHLVWTIYIKNTLNVQF